MKTPIHNDSFPLSMRRGVRGEGNRLDKLFAEKKNNLLNIFFTAGFPQLDSTTEIMLALQKSGADIIEIGMPYSDPVADGPVIQFSNNIALKNGMNMQLLFQQMKEVKDDMNIPVVLMGYFNPVLQYGVENFCADAKAAGADAIILPDLPMHEFESLYKKIFEQHGLHFIFLITPETTDQRIKKADTLSSGFLYAVSSSSTTGAKKEAGSKNEYFKRLSAMKLQNPVMIGFGIHDHNGFTEACAFASGAIIGTAYINAIRDAENIDEATETFTRHILTGKE